MLVSTTGFFFSPISAQWGREGAGFKDAPVHTQVQPTNHTGMENGMKDNKNKQKFTIRHAAEWSRIQTPHTPKK